MTPLRLHLAVEDALSEHVLRVLLAQHDAAFEVGSVFGKSGFGYLRKNLQAFNQAARKIPFIVLTDLDATDCPLALIEEWGLEDPHPHLLFRIAVREVESWVLADRVGFAGFFGLPESRLPLNPDSLQDPKHTVLKLAASCRTRELREAIVRQSGRKLRVGRDYNGTLGAFVWSRWNSRLAASSSSSLKRMLRALDRLPV